MIQLEVLSGRMAGTRWGVRHFPFRLGRAPASDLQLEEAGVWDTHAEIRLERGEGFQIAACGESLVQVNSERVATTRLRPGDLLEIGVVRIRFWLGDAVLRGLRLREVGTWIVIATVLVGQIALIYLLL